MLLHGRIPENCMDGIDRLIKKWTRFVAFSCVAMTVPFRDMHQLNV